MQWSGWTVARMRAWAMPLAAFLMLVALATGILTSTLALAAWTATSAARASLAGAGAGLALQVRAADDVEGQDAAARGALTRAFAPADVTLRTTLVSQPVQTAVGRVVVWHAPSLTPGEVTIIDGRWPARPDEVALQSDAAERVGVAVGDSLTLGSVVGIVTATWRPARPDDPAWQGDGLALTGADGQTIGPLLASQDLVLGLPGDPYLRWGVAPDANALDAADLAALVAGAAEAKAALGPVDVTGRGITVAGDLGDAAAAATVESDTARGVSVIPLSVVAAVIVIALAQVSRVLTSLRDPDLSTMIARGATPGQVTATSAAEGAAIVGIGVAIGALAGALTTAASTGSEVGWRVPAASAGTVAALALGILSLTVHAHARRRARRPHGDARGAAGRAVGVVAGTLIPAAAVLTGWRLLRDGGLTAPRGMLDPALLGALAPSALLGAAGIAGLAILVPVARALQAIAGQSRSFGGWLAAAHLSRGVLPLAVAVVLTIVSVGFATVTALASAGGETVGRDLSTLERGADLRVVLDNPVASSTRVTEPPAIDGVGSVTASAPVWFDDAARLGDTHVRLVAAPLAEVTAAAVLPDGLDLPADDFALDAEDPAIPVPDGARTLTVELTGETTLDDWQAAQLALAPELGRRQAEAPYLVGDRDAAAHEVTAEAMAPFTAGVTIRVETALRNPETGVVSTVAGPELTVPGVGIDRDPASGAVGWKPASAAAELRSDLPVGPLVVDGIRLTVSGGGPITLATRVRVLADGQPLAAPSPWSADGAVPDEAAQPYRDLMAGTSVEVAVTEHQSGGLTTFRIESNRPRVPPVLAADPDGGWRITGEAASLAENRIGPAVPFSGDDPLGVVAMSANPVAPVPVALTPSAASAAALGPGDEFEILAFQRRIPAILTDIVPAVPGTTQASAAFADSTALARVVAAVGASMPWPDEIWASTPTPGDDAVVVAALDGVASVEVPTARVTAVGASGATLTAGAIGALVLALAGVAATFVALGRERRPETRALHRLGAGGGAQALSRMTEHSGVLLAASVLGVAGGWATGALVVPPIVRAATGADPGWPVPLTLDVRLFGALLAGWLVLAGAVVAAEAVAVRRDASRSPRGTAT